MKKVLTFLLFINLIIHSSSVVVASNQFNFNGNLYTQGAALSIVNNITVLQQSEKNLIITAFSVCAVTIIIMIILIALLIRSIDNTKKAAFKIQNFNKLRQTFMDANTNYMYLKDENLNYIFVNQAYEKFKGKTEEEIVGHNDFVFGDNSFAEISIQTDREVLEKLTLVKKEVVWKNRTYVVTKFPVEMVDGSIGVGASIKDITEEKEKELFKNKILERTNILVETFNYNFQDTKEQLDYVLHKVLHMTESKFGFIYLYDEDKHEFTLNSWSEDVSKYCGIIKPKTKYPLEKSGVWGDVVRKRGPIVINDFTNYSQKTGYPEGHIEIKKFMSVPIFVDEKIVATVGLANRESDYKNIDVMNVTILMSGIWQVIERKKIENKLISERKKYFQTLISIGDGVLVVDINGNVEILNTVAEKLTGWKAEEAIGKSYKEVFLISHEISGNFLQDPIESVFQTNTLHEIGNHAVLTSKNGIKYFIEDSAAPIINQYGKTDGVVLVFRDVTEKKKQKKNIEFLSFHDVLTGLYNRRFFEERLVCMDTEENLPISIIMADVNGLKLANDIFGHSHGDILLKTVGEVLKEHSRPPDVAARWGGDEFVVLLPKTNTKELEEIISNLKVSFSQHNIKGIKVSVSMGGDCKFTSDQSLLDTLNNAEEEMYFRKTTEREEIKDEELKSLIKTLHSLNPKIMVHSKNVETLCELFGKALDLNISDSKRLAEAGYLHDIGKVILDAELFKKENLTQEQLAETRKHPVVGFRILNSMDKTLNLAEIILAHHEHWDGSGYPKGLKTDEIPFYSRIISIVECYEKALTYLNGSKEKALQIIANGKGNKFDPEIAEKFIQIMTDLKGTGLD